MEKTYWLLEGEKLAAGSFQGTRWDGNCVILEEGCRSGIYMSPICEERPFQKAVASWNSSTPEGSSVEIQLRIWRQGEGGEQPSQWYSWGMWGVHIDRKSRSITEEEAPDEGISMDTDTLSLSGRKALRFQFRVLFTGEKESPSLYLLGLTVPVEKPERNMDSAGLVPWPQNLPFRAETEVPACSQLLRDPVFARVICSAVTVQMLTARGTDDFLPEEIAWCNYDSAMDGHGNWSFSTAMAGELGYRAWAAYLPPEELLWELAAGRPVGVSVRYSNEPDHAKLPYLENAPGNTPGHLLVLYGYEREGDILWLLAADPYGERNETARRRYRWEHFLKAWSGRLTYLVHEKRKGFSQKAIERIPVTFLGKENGEYELFFGKNRLVLEPSEIGSCVLLSAEEAENGRLSVCVPFFGSITQRGLLSLPTEAVEYGKNRGPLKGMLVDRRGHTYEGVLGR